MSAIWNSHPEGWAHNALPLRAVVFGPMLQHGKTTLRPQPIECSRECDRLPDVRDATDPRDGPLDAESESRMHERAVLAQIEIPGVRLLRQLLGADAREQLVVVVLPLAAADDLAVALGREAVVVEHGTRIGRILLHIEGLHSLRIVVDENRP